MAEDYEELKSQILEHMQKTGKEINTRDLAKALKVSKKDVDKAAAELLRDGRLEYASYGGVSYLKLPQA
jgi:Mn-dependent DtxR family transcriptional regulator